MIARQIHRALAIAISGWALAVSATTVSIADCGAVGDGQTLNTHAIQMALDRCAEEGGGTVVVPKGTFLTGSIFIPSKIDLTLQPGAVLLGSQNTNDYPWIDTRIAGFEMKWPAALINARFASNLSITGKGIIDGNGMPWWKEYWNTRAQETDGLDPHFKVPRPRLIHIFAVSNAMVSGVLLRNSAFWTVQLTYCGGVVVSNITIRNPHAPVHAASSDGIDIDSSHDVLVDSCDIVCDDDGICLKSGRDADGLRVNRPTENVTIRHCRVGYSAGMVVFGSETSGGIRHVRISHCRANDGCGCVARFKTLMGRGGTVEDVIFDHIEAEDVRSVIGFNMNAHSKTWLPEQFRKPAPADKGIPGFRDIVIRNVVARNCDFVGDVAGTPAIPVRDLTLENVAIEAADAQFPIRNAPGLKIMGFTINGKPLSAVDP